MSVAIAVLVALLLSSAGPYTGSCIDPIGGCANAHASAVSTDAGVRIDPEG
jgi:hypothetical protein